MLARARILPVDVCYVCGHGFGGPAPLLRRARARNATPDETLECFSNTASRLVVGMYSA